MSTGFKLPKPNGNILIGLQEDFWPLFVGTAKKFSDMGYSVSPRDAYLHLNAILCLLFLSSMPPPGLQLI